VFNHKYTRIVKACEIVWKCWYF